MLRTATALALLWVSPAAAQAPVIGIWELEEASGFAAADTGPAANHGNLTGFTNDPNQWVPGRWGNALAFDGLDDLVRLAPIGGLPFYTGYGATFSVCFWVNGSATADDRVICLGSSGSDVPLFSFGTGVATAGGTDKLRVYARNGQNIASARYSSVPVFDHTWHHVAYVELSGQARLYVDGVLDPASMDDRFNARGSRTATHGTYGFDLIAFGGVLRPSACCWWAGMLDSVHIYRCVLSPTDVRAVMNGGRAAGCAPSFGEYGVGCGPGPLDLFATGSPVLGGPGIFFTMRGGSPAASVSLNVGTSSILPLDLASFGLYGCNLYDPSGTIFGIGTCDAFGSFNGFALPVPNLPVLRNLTVSFQGLTIASPGDIRLSHAVLALLAR